MVSSNQYSAIYTEEQCIGRGNFGAAMLVTHKKENERYIAKKVMLEGLSDKEQEGCMMEVNLLKNLDHPNIVRYKESFVTPTQMAIIMEYCEVGDLAYHIKRKQAKSEHFTEMEIFNWFVQICLALEYVHARKVIHRDIKTQNVFLTGNNTIKVGDFGISKVLESTTQVANTVVGTPYYMAPEACQSEPYTSKSDVWALGCILYELCTFQKPFACDNLLGLVFKIVSEQQPPIPSELPYSVELRDLVDKLLCKDPKNRPSVAQILSMNMVRTKMAEFVRNKGNTQQRGMTIYRKQNPTIKVKNDFTQEIKIGEMEGTVRQMDGTVRQLQLEKSQESAEATMYPNETPAQRMARRKREAADAQAALMTNAAKGAVDNYAQANQLKIQQHTSNSGQNAFRQAQIQRQQQSGAGFFDPDDNSTMNFGTVRSLEQSQKQQVMVDFGNQQSPSQSPARFSNHKMEMDRNDISDFGLDLTQHNLNNSGAAEFFQPDNVYDDRPINASGKYDMTSFNMYGVPGQEVEITENLQEVEEVQGDNDLLDTIVERYKEILDEQVQLESAQVLENEEMQAREDHEAFQQREAQKTKLMKEDIKAKMGTAKYEEVYRFLHYHRAQQSGEMNDDLIYEELKKKVNGDRYLMTEIFKLDGIVFREVLQNQEIMGDIHR